MTNEDKAYIRANYSSITVLDMAKHLKRGAATIYAFLSENSLQPFKKPLTRTETHPFRRQNKKLEVYLSACEKKRKSKEKA